MNIADRKELLDYLERTLDVLISEMNLCLHTYTCRDSRIDVDGFTEYLKKRMFDYTELLREEAENENQTQS